MSSLLRAYAISVAVTLAIARPALPGGLQKPASDPQEDVRRTLLANARGFASNDLHTVEAAWSHGDDVTVFESGHANYGWSDYRDHHLRPEMAELKNVQYQLSEIKIHIAGTTAWATFKYTIVGDLPGRHVDASGLGTGILEKQSDGWKIVHWHSSSPRKPAGPVKTP